MKTVPINIVHYGFSPARLTCTRNNLASEPRVSWPHSAPRDGRAGLSEISPPPPPHGHWRSLRARVRLCGEVTSLMKTVYNLREDLEGQPRTCACIHPIGSSRMALSGPVS